METKLEFKGTGGELFKSLFVGLLLCSVTLGIYYPWFLVAMNRMILERTVLHSGGKELRLKYTATGGALFKQLFLGYLFTLWSFGIYLPWLVMRLVRFQQEHTLVIDEGRSYALRTKLTGGELFKSLIGGYLLVGITFGVYLPWFVTKLCATLLDRTEILADGEPVGQLRFDLKGGELFKTFIVGYLLTVVTMGIYMFWLQVKMLKLFANATEIRIGEGRYRADFTGTGGEYFKVNFVGYLLTMITFGIYGFWYIANLLRYQLSHTRFVPAGELTARAVPTARVADEGPSDTIAQPQRALARADLVAQGRDRRAAWAQAFLPPVNEVQEWQATLPQSVSIGDLAEVWTDSAAARAPLPRAHSVN